MNIYIYFAKNIYMKILKKHLDKELNKDLDVDLESNIFHSNIVFIKNAFLSSDIIS